MFLFYFFFRNLAIYCIIDNCLFVIGCQCLFLHLPAHPGDGKSWLDARSICSSYQGSLVSIEDEIEQGKDHIFITFIIVSDVSLYWHFCVLIFWLKTTSSCFFMVGLRGFGLVHRVVFPPSGATGSWSAIITGRYKDSVFNISEM